MKIRQNRLDRQYFEHQAEFEEKALEVLRGGMYVLGKEVSAFEREFADYLGVKNCVGVACGLDALRIAVHLLGIGEGDEVIVQGNTYIASVMGITMNGATPVFVEPNEFYSLDAERLEEKITKHTKAILVVHLFGQATNMEKILSVAGKYGLKIIEDCAQSHGSSWKGRKTGTIGDVGCFSFFPTKNLGCFGDGGAIVTDDDHLAEQIRIYRNYGSCQKYVNVMQGANSRLDEIQAALLRVKLKYLDTYNLERNRTGEKYLRGIKNPLVELPKIAPDCTSVWHQFVLRTKFRDALAAYLERQGIQTLVHYPIPPHLQEAYRYLNVPKGALPITEQLADEVLSLPMYCGMTDQEIDTIVGCVNQFSN